MTRRALGGVLLAALAVPLAGAPATAAGPTSITITGAGLPTPLQLRADADPELFAAVLSQVSWMANAREQARPLAAGKLGPKYTLVVLVKDKARQTYDLYPLAAGGPRAYRPAKQPDLRKTTGAWFYGRLNMSETLRVAGVPLPVRPDALSGGIGGGVGRDGAEESAATTLDPLADLRAAMAEWRRLFLLNGAVVLAIAVGLAGFALLIRPKDPKPAPAEARPARSLRTARPGRTARPVEPARRARTGRPAAGLARTVSPADALQRLRGLGRSRGAGPSSG